jgi:hypothetical protein
MKYRAERRVSAPKLMIKYKATGKSKKGQPFKKLWQLWKRRDIWPISHSFLATTLIITMIMIMAMILKVDLRKNIYFQI